MAALAALGIGHFYVSNLPSQGAAVTMGEILSRVQGGSIGSAS
jgi:hypothetical protein